MPVEQIQKAVELILQQVKIDSENVTNAFITGSVFKVSEMPEVHELMKPIADFLCANTKFREYVREATDDFRHQYRFHGQPLEGLVASMMTTSFVAGVQFMLNGMKATDPRKSSDPLNLPPPSQLLN